MRFLTLNSCLQPHFEIVFEIRITYALLVSMLFSTDVINEKRKELLRILLLVGGEFGVAHATKLLEHPWRDILFGMC